MTRIRSGIAASVFLGLVLALPGGALANTNEPIAQTGGMEATLPLLGSTLTVGVTLDDVGKITGVSLSPSGAVTKTESSDAAVKFSDSAGTTQVVVRARGAKETIAAKVKSLADITGTGSWKADVFGTGASSTVAYTIGADGEGKPTVAIGAISAPSGVTATKEEAVKGDGKGRHHVKAWAAGVVMFTREGFTKRLTIAVTVKDDDTAFLKISLKGKDRQRLEGTLEQLAGARTWSAHLCDGTAVSVRFHVTAEATVAFDGASGAPATEKAGKHGALRVRFDGTRVGMMALVTKKDDTRYRLTVKGVSGHCGGKAGDGWKEKAGDKTSGWSGGDWGRIGSWSRDGDRDGGGTSFGGWTGGDGH